MLGGAKHVVCLYFLYSSEARGKRKVGASPSKNRGTEEAVRGVSFYHTLREFDVVPHQGKPMRDVLII
jgi:hypothetical protein